MKEELNDRDQDRLELHEVDWIALDDGHETLLVYGGGINGGLGVYELHADQPDLLALRGDDDNGSE